MFALAFDLVRVNGRLRFIIPITALTGSTFFNSQICGALSVFIFCEVEGFFT